MDYKDLSFPVKIMVGYLVGVLILTILFSISIIHLSTILGDYNSMVKNSWRRLNALQTVRAQAIKLRLDVIESPAEVKTDLSILDGWFDVFLQLSRDGQSTDLVPLVRDLYTFRKQTLDFITAAVPSPQGLIRDYNQLSGGILVEIEKEKANVDLSESGFLARINQLLLLNVILAPLNFLFLYYYGFFISNYLGQRLRGFLQILSKILSGDYKQRIADDSQDEIGQIAQGVNELVGRLNKP